ncbi:MAG: hypothetical protein LBD40_03460 [Puniceicoccales bacterium]|jgi:hypothetical protein|nr:hypothetical protein [Puniceicoccales bacterium]
MGDLQIETVTNSGRHIAAKNVNANEDLFQNNAEDGITRSKESSGDIGFVGDSDSLVIGGGDAHNPSVNAPVAAQNKPAGA